MKEHVTLEKVTEAVNYLESEIEYELSTLTKGEWGGLELRGTDIPELGADPIFFTFNSHSDMNAEEIHKEINEKIDDMYADKDLNEFNLEICMSKMYDRGDSDDPDYPIEPNGCTIEIFESHPKY